MSGMGTELYINLSVVLVGLVPLLFGLWQLKRGLSNRSWSMVEGTITKLKIVKSGAKFQGFHPQISYEYWVGPDHTGFSGPVSQPPRCDASGLA